MRAKKNKPKKIIKPKFQQTKGFFFFFSPLYSLFIVNYIGKHLLTTHDLQ
jgi:hypothetical protein